jgi:hypothetical protein
LYVQDEYIQGYQAHPQQTQALPSPRSFHKLHMSLFLLELALVIQPITVRYEQLLETSGKILDHIVSEANDLAEFALSMINLGTRAVVGSPPPVAE